MCGIAGAVDRQAPPDEIAVRAMVRRLAHRGPDDEGVWRSPAGACVLGHARLSIIDLTAAGHQPMVDEIAGNAITFNGEIYNFAELRAHLARDGEAFHSHTDTEVLLALYRRYGIACLHRLRGMFAFAIWDRAHERLFLARDRLGKKPLNYAVTPHGIAFASEIEALSRFPGVDRAIDSDALQLYLQCQFVPAPWSIYRGIRKLRPGHYAIWDRTGLRIEQYWRADYRDKLRITESEALDVLEDKLTEAVRLRMIADVPVGAFLSGGVDSSVVVALMSKVSREPVRTFSMGFDREEFDELPYAEEAARRCGTHHHTERLAGAVESVLDQLPRHYGEPFGDASAVPSFYIAAAARKHVTVALNGDGGDELLGGYPRYTLSGLALRLGRALDGLVPSSALVALVPHLAQAHRLPARALRKLLSQYTHPELRGLLMFSEFWNEELRAELVPDADPRPLALWRSELLDTARRHADNAVDRMLWLDVNGYLPGDLLVKVDIASMHCGLEARSPLLDHEVVEFCMRLPVEYKVRDGIGKYLLKKLAERYFPHAFVHRPKMGFGIPLAAWLRGPLSSILHDVLLNPSLMWPLSPRPISRIFDQFNAGDNSAHESRLWLLLMYGLWRRHVAAER